MVAQWFPPKYVGRAEGFYAGWGNFGSAFAAMTLPWFAITVLGNWLDLGDDAWRWAMAINGIVLAIYGVMYYFLVATCPTAASSSEDQEGRADAVHVLLGSGPSTSSGRSPSSVRSVFWRGGSAT